MEWSKIMQPPKYLMATRQAYLNEEFAEISVKHCGISDESYVLEVGCGTGCFSRFLSTAVTNVRFVGIDNDVGLLENGQKMVGKNNIEYIECSAFELPFMDSTFDAVVSHTFFNCVSDPEKAMDEMKRVIKKGRQITSVTSMSLGYETWYTGDYPDGCEWKKQIDQYEREMVLALEKIKLGPYSHSKGYHASIMPSFFSRSGLFDVHIFPLSRAFSLSNAAMSKKEKFSYIENLYYGELAKLEGAMESQEFEDLFSLEKYHLYCEALKNRFNFWSLHLDDNCIWDWYGSSSLLVSGVCR